ncbi:hypothetical protein [Nocardiopsis coralliicola]
MECAARAAESVERCERIGTELARVRADLQRAGGLLRKVGAAADSGALADDARAWAADIAAVVRPIEQVADRVPLGPLSGRGECEADAGRITDPPSDVYTAAGRLEAPDLAAAPSAFPGEEGSYTLAGFLAPDRAGGGARGAPDPICGRITSDVAAVATLAVHCCVRITEGLGVHTPPRAGARALAHEATQQLALLTALLGHRHRAAGTDPLRRARLRRAASAQCLDFAGVLAVEVCRDVDLLAQRHFTGLPE